MRVFLADPPGVGVPRPKAPPVLQSQLLEVGEVVRGTDLLLRRLIGKGVELVTLPGGGVGKVMADASQLEQVLVNLVLNSRDALPQGGGLRSRRSSAASQSP